MERRERNSEREEWRLEEEETKTQRERDRNPKTKGDRDPEYGTETQRGVSGTHREKDRHPGQEADQSAPEKKRTKRKRQKKAVSVSPRDTQSLCSMNHKEIPQIGACHPVLSQPRKAVRPTGRNQSLGA